MNFNPNIYINNANVYPNQSTLSVSPAETPKKRQLDIEGGEKQPKKFKLIYNQKQVELCIDEKINTIEVLNKQMFKSKQVINEKDKEIYEKNEEIKSLKNKIKLLEDDQKLRDTQVKANLLSLENLQKPKQCQVSLDEEERTRNYIFWLESCLESKLLLEQELYKKDQTIDTLDQESGMKDQYINGLNHDINGLNQELYKKDQTINALDQELYKKDQTINALDQELYKKDQYINGLNHELYKKDQTINALVQDLFTKNRSFITLNHNLDESRNQLNEFKKQVVEFQNNNANHVNHINHLNNLVNALQQNPYFISYPRSVSLVPPNPAATQHNLKNL